MILLRKILFGLVFVFLSLFLLGRSHVDKDQSKSPPAPTLATEIKPTNTPEFLNVTPDLLKEVKKVKFVLDNGLSFTIDVYPKIAPNTAKNFLAKFQSGYYNELKFHRVEDWVVQGGDPLGTGGGGGNIQTELNNQPFLNGAVGVARRDDIKQSNDSQFFIVKKDSSFLNEKYTNFGQVSEGLENISKISKDDKIKSTSY